MNAIFKKNQENLNEEIDIGLIIKFFIRNRFLITSCTFIIASLFGIYSLLKKEVWVGNFEIVIQKSREFLKNVLNI